jgi:hypothetical protein
VISSGGSGFGACTTLRVAVALRTPETAATVNVRDLAELTPFGPAITRAVAEPELQATVRVVALVDWCITKVQRLAWTTRAFRVTGPPPQGTRAGVTTNDLTTGFDTGFGFVTVAAPAAEAKTEEAATNERAVTVAKKVAWTSRPRRVVGITFAKFDARAEA